MLWLYPSFIQAGLDPLENVELNFLFVGNPGCGKTTVARRVGSMFEGLGLLGSSELVEKTASDLITGYAGQAAKATCKVFESGLGKVLFIDKAYRLNPRIGGPYMREALDEIVQILTEDRFKGKMVVIFAGYEKEMEELLDVNPGLRSRVSTKLRFEDLTQGAAADLLRKVLEAKSARLTTGPEMDRELPRLLARLIEAPGWSNGRTLHTWAKKLFAASALRRAAADKGSTGRRGQGPGIVIEVEDLSSTVEELIRSESERGDPPLPLWASLPMAMQDAPLAAAPALVVTTRAAEAKLAEEVLEEELPPHPAVDLLPPNTFEGQDKDFLQALQVSGRLWQKLVWYFRP